MGANRHLDKSQKRKPLSMLFPSTTPFCEGTGLSAAVSVKTETGLQQPPEACSRSAPLIGDQKVTFDLEGTLICLKNLSN